MFEGCNSKSIRVIDKKLNRIIDKKMKGRLFRGI